VGALVVECLVFGGHRGGAVGRVYVLLRGMEGVVKLEARESGPLVQIRR
jgi:hypothetical protein